MTALSDLIARLEAAKEGSRELDVAIIRAGYGIPIVQDSWSDQDLLAGDIVPMYTRSLDAALTLVPDGWQCDVRICDGACRATVGGTKKFGEARAPTAALALCIAALKAREAAK